MHDPIRVYIVDDHTIVRSGIQALLATEAAITVIGEAGDGKEAVAGVLEHNPDIGAGAVIEVYGQNPAQAGSAWLSLNFVVDGLGGGNEIVGGLWVLLVSWAGLRAGGLPRALNYLGVLVSLAGLVTVVPALGEVGAIFWLGSILWFVWLGIAMLRTNPSAAAVKSNKFVPRIEQQPS